MSVEYDVLVVGGGPAGITSAIYSARAGWKTLVLDPLGGGGRASTTDMIYNYPGFPEGISGPKLMGLMIEQAQTFGVQIVFEEVKGIQKSNGIFTVKGEEKEYQSKTVILATGTRPKPLKVPGEDKFVGRGISFCATCDGALFKNKVVAVVGGGDSALTEAEFLTKFASQVVVIHRRDRFRAGQASVKRVAENPKIKIKLNTVVEEIRGNEKLQSMLIRDKKKGETAELKVDGLFLYIGSIPNSSIAKGLVDLDEFGYVKTHDDMSTKTPGLFAAGDIRRKPLRQISTAVGDGANAAWAAERYLLENSDFRKF